MFSLLGYLKQLLLLFDSFSLLILLVLVQELVDVVDVVERVVNVELELRATAQLVAHLLGKLVADASLVLIDIVDDGLGIFAGKDAQTHVGHTQVRRDTHAAHRHECATGLCRLAAEDLAQLLLHQAADFLLSCRIHSID